MERMPAGDVMAALREARSAWLEGGRLVLGDAIGS